MNNRSNKDDIDSKIADFMADIDEIVQGKKPHPQPHDAPEWKQCFDEKTQAVYYWNTKTNECSWESPFIQSENHHAGNPKSSSVKKRSQANDDDDPSPKKPKKPSLIAEYASSTSSEEEEEGEDLDDEENVDHIDELLNEVLEKKENLKKKVPPVDPFPSFEADCRNAIARLVELGDRTTEVFSLRIQLETRLEDCLAGHLPKVYAMNKLNEALIRIEEFEKTSVISAPLPNPEPVKAPLTANEMVLLLSLPPPPPPPSPPPSSIASTALTDPTMQQFYAELNADSVESEKPSPAHHRHSKDRKLKPSKNFPTDLVQKWTHAREELRGFEEMHES